MGFFTKSFGSASNNPELELEKKFLPVIMQEGLTEHQAHEVFKNLLKEVKSDISSQDPLPSNMGDYLLANEKNKEGIQAILQERRTFGVTDEDIRYWWNLDELERELIKRWCNFQFETLYSVARGQGMSSKEAEAKAMLSIPVYGEKNFDKFIPYEIKWKVDAFLKNLMLDTANQQMYKDEIAQAGSMNSFVKERLGIQTHPKLEASDIICENMEIIGTKSSNIAGSLLEFWNKQAGITMNRIDFSILQVKSYLFLVAATTALMKQRGYLPEIIESVKNGLLPAYKYMVSSLEIAEKANINAVRLDDALLEGFNELFVYDSIADATDKPLVLLFAFDIFGDLLYDHKDVRLCTDTAKILENEVNTLSLLIKI